MTSLKTAGLAAVLAVLTMAAQAGPAMYFYYKTVQTSVQGCVEFGYEALDQQGMPPPGKMSGDQNFAMGTSRAATVIVDCSLVEDSGRVTVMSSSQDGNLANRVAQAVLNKIAALALQGSSGYRGNQCQGGEC